MNYSLTPKEIEIAANVIKGLTNKEIARIQGIEEMTVKIHINHILGKLDLKNRSQLIVHFLTL
jgi:DNA-binding CsgD family transcriptional regulator